MDAKEGKIALRLKNVHFIESMQYNILSMQQLYTSDFIPVYKEVADKAVLKKILPNNHPEQVALLSASKTGRRTLDCRIFSAPPPACAALNMVAAAGAAANPTPALPADPAAANPAAPVPAAAPAPVPTPQPVSGYVKVQGSGSGGAAAVGTVVGGTAEAAAARGTT